MDSALRALLVRRPDALVLATGPEGNFIPLPDTLGLPVAPTPRVRSTLDLVHLGDRLAVIEAWERATSEGAARVFVRLAGAGDRTAWFHIFNVKATVGADITVILMNDATAYDLEAVVNIAPPQPRSVRARKNEWAHLLEVEEGVTAMLGWTPADMARKRSLDFLHPDDHEHAVNAWMDVLAHPGATGRCRVRHQHRDGHWVWLELSNWNRLDDPSAATWTARCPTSAKRWRRWKRCGPANSCCAGSPRPCRWE
jgi:PAS domain S-box-containing protein